jgi:hypothetical protein
MAQLSQVTSAEGSGDYSPAPRSTEVCVVELVPSRDFDPNLEEALRFTHALTVVRAPRLRLRRSLDFVRIRLRSVAPGRMAYLLQAPPDALRAILARLPEGITVRDATDLLAPQVPDDRAVARCLAKFPSPAREVPLKPDPLTDFARVFAGVSNEESLELVFDLLPLTRGESSQAPSVPLDSPLSRAVTGFAKDLGHHLTKGSSAPPPSRAVKPPTKVPVPKPPAAPTSTGAVFAVQVVSEARASSRPRASELARAVVAPLGHWAGPAQRLSVSSHSPSAEHRMLGNFLGSRRAPAVSAVSLAGLVLPPTASCGALNVRRAAASAPVPTNMLEPGPGVFSLGHAEGYAEPVGLPASDVLFGAFYGRTGSGKTQEAKRWFLGQVLDSPERLGNGGVFIDPLRDAIESLAEYLSGPSAFPGAGDISSRVIRIDLGRPWEDLRLPIWNPLDAAEVSDEEGEERVAAIVAAFLAATGWTKATRATTFVQESCRFLVALARELGPGAPAPTIFQIGTVLTNDHWRETILASPRMPQGIRDWWRNQFSASKKGDASAVLPVTFLISRLRASTPIAAFLGGTSTFDFREAMDERRIILFAPPVTADDKAKLATSIFVRGILQGAYSRADVPATYRGEVCPRFWIFGDEMPMWDGPDIPRIFQQLRKFYVHLLVFAQSPRSHGLSKATAEASMNAASILAASTVNGPGAKMIAAHWTGPDADDLQQVERYTYLASVMHEGKQSGAFLCRAIQPQEVYPREPGGLEAAIAHDPRYRLASEVVAELDTLDDRLLKAWTGDSGPGGRVSVAT